MKKRLLSLVLTACMLLGMLPGAALAADATITIKINDVTTEYGDVSLQAAVTAAGGVSAVTKLTITAGEVTEADWTWLKKLTALTDFTIDAALTKVADIPDATGGSRTFPTSIQRVTIPQAIVIGTGAFFKCTALTSANFTAAKSIGKSAFSGCAALTSISIPDTVTAIGNGAFESSGLTSVVVPSGIETMNNAFYFCKSLVSVTAPGVKTISVSAFSECKALTTAIFPQATTISAMAFNGCTALATLKLGAEPPTVTPFVNNSTTYYGIFDDITSASTSCALTLVDESGNDLTESALSTALAKYRAVDDSNLTGEAANNSTWYKCKIGEEAPKITIKINNGATEYGGDTMQAAVTKALGLADISTITKLTIIKGEVTAADWLWFSDKENTSTPVMTALTDFTIDAAVVSVADIHDTTSWEATFFPKSILNVTIPQAIKIGKSAFDYCEALVTAIIPNAKEIGNYALRGTALTSASFPKVTSIGDLAFQNCKKLAALTLGATPPTMGDSVFASVPANSGTLTLVDGSGTPLAESTTPKLSAVAAEYDKVTTNDTGTATDGLWYGWKVREPIVDAEAEWTPTDGAKTSGTFAAALTAMTAKGGEIKLLKNVSTAEEATLPAQTITLDLNGQTWTAGKTVAVEAGGNLTLTDTSAGNEGVFLGNAANYYVLNIAVGGTATLTGGTVKKANTSNSAVRNAGTLLMEDGATVSLSSADEKYTLDSAILNDNGGELTMTGGTVTSKNGYGIKNAATVQGSDDITTATITGGTITGKRQAIENQSILRLGGGTLTSTGMEAVLNKGSKTLYLYGAPVFHSLTADRGDIIHEYAQGPLFCANNGDTQSPVYYTGAAIDVSGIVSAAGITLVSDLKDEAHTAKFNFINLEKYITAVYNDTDKTIKSVYKSYAIAYKDGGDGEFSGTNSADLG